MCGCWSREAIASQGDSALGDSGGNPRRNRPGSLPPSEVITTVRLFHRVRGQQFKAFYRGTVCRFMTKKETRTTEADCASVVRVSFWPGTRAPAGPLA